MPVPVLVLVQAESHANGWSDCRQVYPDLS